MAEEVGAFLWDEASGQSSESVPQRIDGLDGFGSQQGLEFGERHLNRVQIGAVGWDEHQARTGRFDRLAHAADLMRAQIVHDDDIAWFQRCDQDLLDIGQKHRAVDGAIEHARRHQTIAA